MVVGAAVFLAAPHGLTAVCLAVLGVRIVRYFAAYVFLLNRLAGVSIAEAWRDPGPALVAGGAMAAGVIALQALVLAALTPAVEVALVAVAAVPLYLGALAVLFPGSLADLRGGVRRLLGSRGAGDSSGPAVAHFVARRSSIRARTVASQRGPIRKRQIRYHCVLNEI